MRAATLSRECASNGVDDNLDAGVCGVGRHGVQSYVLGVRPQLLHLSGPLRGKTVTYATNSLLIGSALTAKVCLKDPAVAGQHAVIEYNAPDCSFHLRGLSGAIFVNHIEVLEVILTDGDLIEFGIDGPRARFRAFAPNGSVCKPVRRMLLDAREVGRHSGSISAVRGFTRDILTLATPQLKVGVPVLIAVLALPLGWIAGWFGSQPSEAARLANLVALEDINKLREGLAAEAKKVDQLSAANELPREVRTKWGLGVCLIHGIVGMKDASGEVAQNESEQPFEFEYSGTGFLVGADGAVVTNRHVVAPWEYSEDLKPLLAAGYTPFFSHFTSTFPDRAPISIEPGSVRMRSDQIDVAIYRLLPSLITGLPLLPLHVGSLESLPDQRAIVVGYPTGLSALLAKAAPAVVAALQKERANMTLVIAKLSSAGEVSPTITQGIISDALPEKLVYDAPTTHGGSGGPVFGGDGKVIAVNHAILQGFGGANYGVPVSFVWDLLNAK